MHESVLLHESVTALVTDTAGIYVDGTFGRGGHSRHILQRLTADAQLLAFDKDPVAIDFAATAFSGESRLRLQHASFSQLKARVMEYGLLGKVDGILLDLGVSSPQLDVAERGFSFLRDGPLDMRMDTRSGETAAQWLNRADRYDIRHVLQVYGDERFAGLIAQRIVERRATEPFLRTLDLANFIADVVPKKDQGKNPATRTFQALRIFINKELDDLELLLADVMSVLKVGGRLVVISFHSLEDRIVKQYIRAQEQGPQLPRRLPVMATARGVHMHSVGKMIKANEDEIASNPRARSAVMRIAQKVA